MQEITIKIFQKKKERLKKKKFGRDEYLKN